jgi:hypothetical protein
MTLSCKKKMITKIKVEIEKCLTRTENYFTLGLGETEGGVA